MAEPLTGDPLTVSTLSATQGGFMTPFLLRIRGGCETPSGQAGN